MGGCAKGRRKILKSDEFQPVRFQNFVKTEYFGNPGLQGNGRPSRCYAGCQFASASIYSTMPCSKYSTAAQPSCGSSSSLPGRVRQVPFLLAQRRVFRRLSRTCCLLPDSRWSKPERARPRELYACRRGECIRSPGGRVEVSPEGATSSRRSRPARLCLCRQAQTFPAFR